MTGQVDIDQWLQNIKAGEILTERDLRILCDKIKEILIEESNVQPVSAPVTIVGDVHGQFHDVLELFKAGGEIPNTRYIFIGDFVDRGYYSIETFTLLMCLKVKYSSAITLLRGNHECRQISNVYGFYDEIIKKYGNANPWKYCTDVFDYLGIAAVVEGSVFCIHGGLSPEIKSLDQIRLLERRIEIPSDGAFCDLMWSDPEDIEFWQLSPRGAGWCFGEQITTEFNHLNGIDLIARAHQLVMDGYRYWFQEKNLVSVWSAVNYTYRCGNDASILTIDKNLNRRFDIFHPSQQKQTIVHYSSIVPYFM